MKLKKLSFKNFKSYSNILTEIDFDKTSSLNLIIGDNGTGKTSIAECVTYLLYGKLDDFNASDIPNRVNKNFYGKIELDCSGHQIIIERGISPGLFKVQIDGNIIDTAGKLNVQSMLEEKYFKISYSVFNNIVILEVGDVKSLLNMNAADKRNIIDKICGFTIYNAYTKIVKEDSKALEDRINGNDVAIRTINNNLLHYEQEINEINSNNISQDELDTLLKNIEKAKKMKEDLEVKIRKLRDKNEELKGQNIQKIGDYNNLKEKIKIIEKKIALIDGGKCPTCGSSLETEDFQKEKDDLLKQKHDFEEQMKKIVELVNTTKNHQKILETKSNELTSESSKIRLMDIQSEYSYKKAIRERGTESIESMKKKVLVDLDNLKNEQHKLEETKKIMDFFVMMFSDGGIKRYISNQYIPIINKLMSDMLNYMGLNYSVVFNNNFDATIKQNGGIVKYSTLSKGQKARVDFAAIIAFVKFLKLQFGELNLMFLDELFAYVDINGMNDMVDILRNLSVDMNMNIYLIHHAKLENVMFDKILHTTMKDGFSHLEYM